MSAVRKGETLQSKQLAQGSVVRMTVSACAHDK